MALSLLHLARADLERDAVSFFGPTPVIERGKVPFDWTENS